MSPKRILIIEDDLSIRQGMEAAVRYTGYAVSSAGDGLRGVELARSEAVDLVLLDLVLPGQGGLETMDRLRSLDPALPVIIVTARGAEAERVEGLRRGADDYIVKPFGAQELLARIEAVLRRSPERRRGLPSLPLPDGEVDFERLEVRGEDGAREELTPLEGDLLRYLAERSGRVISRTELLNRVWDARGHAVATRAVDMTVARLRRKLAVASQDEVLVTVRGKGYKLARSKGAR